MDVNHFEQIRAWKQCWWLVRKVGALLAVVLLVLGALVPGSAAQAASLDSSGLCTPAKRGMNLALPAVVRVTTTYQAQLTYTASDGSSITFPLGGGYYPLTVTGSGALISGNGDVLTAARVVTGGQDALDQLLIQRAAPDIAQALNNAHPSQTYTEQDIANQLLTDPSIWQGSYQSGQSQIFLSSQYAGPTEATSLSDVQGLPATVVAQGGGDQAGGNDLAVLHVNGLRDMPTIPLGDSSQVYQGDTLTVLGYPGSADLASSDGTIDPNNFLTASVKTVTVSALKTAGNGAHLIQVSGNVESGDSGGPALNADGQLIGVVSADVSSQGNPGQTSFLLMVNDARSLIRQAGVKPGQDAFDKRWAAAYDACMSTTPGHWHDAYSQYVQLEHLYPRFKGVQLYLNYTRAQAAHESAPGQLHLPAWAIALIIVLLLALVVAVSVFIRRRAARAGEYAGYGPGLSQHARSERASFRPDHQTAARPDSAPAGPSEQVGALPPMDDTALAVNPAWPAFSGEPGQPAGAQATASAQPTSQPDVPERGG